MAAYSLDPLSTELIMVTPTMARTLRETAKYERQRPIHDGHVNRLASEMLAGRFTAGTTVHICRFGDTVAIVNGNHTLEGIIESKVTVPLLFLYTVVKSEEEIARIYASHDIGRARVWADAIRAAGLFGDMDASQQFISSFGSALLPIQLKFQDFQLRNVTSDGPRATSAAQIRARSRELRIALMREYRPQAEFYYLAVKLGRPRIQLWMRRATVFAIALETFKAQPSMATEFWEGLARDDGLKKTDPRKQLLTYLAEHPATESRVVQSRAIASAWNAFFEKRTVTFLRGSDQPFVLRGTPWGLDKAVDADVVRKAPSQTMAIGQSVDSRGRTHAVASLLGEGKAR